MDVVDRVELVLETTNVLMDSVQLCVHPAVLETVVVMDVVDRVELVLETTNVSMESVVVLEAVPEKHAEMMVVDTHVEHVQLAKHVPMEPVSFPVVPAMLTSLCIKLTLVLLIMHLESL